MNSDSSYNNENTRVFVLSKSDGSRQQIYTISRAGDRFAVDNGLIAVSAQFSKDNIDPVTETTVFYLT